MKTKILLVLILIFFPKNFQAQAKKTSDSKEFVYNISLGAIVGTIGAIINKKPDQKLDKIIWKGFYQGALGGYVTFESKRLIKLAEKNDDWKILWCAKLVNAGGISIKENAALNKDFWENWHINFGFSRIEFETKNQFKVHYKVMPVALIYTIGVATQTKFELKKSLESGEFVFSSNSNKFLETNSAGVTFPGAIVLYTPYKDNFSGLSHEIIHDFQANDFSQFDAYFQKPIRYLNTNSKFFNTINQYIYYDFRYLPIGTFYFLESKNATFYYDNFFEREAGYYSNTFNAYLLK